MRIGIFTDAYQPLISGVVTSIKTLKEGLESLGHEVYIITPKAPYKYQDEPRVIRLGGFKIPKKTLKGFRYVFFVKRHLKRMIKLNLDVIHVHTEFSMGKLALSLNKKTHIPMVYTIHTSYQDYVHHISKFMDRYMHNTSMKLAWGINNKFSKRADVTITPSKKTLEKVIEMKHNGNFEVIPSGIDLSPFYPGNYQQEEIEQLKTKLGIKPDEFVCVLVARIAKEKSIGDLVDAFVPFHQKYLKSKFIIIGDGPEKENLDKYIKKYHAQDYIKTIGFVPWAKLGLYYQIGDCFLNASTTETQGLTYIEALAGGLPIIIRYDKVFDGFIENGVNGLFFDKTEELTELLGKVQEDQTLLKKLSDNAFDSVLPYSREKYALNCEAVYQRIMKKTLPNQSKK